MAKDRVKRWETGLPSSLASKYLAGLSRCVISACCATLWNVGPSTARVTSSANIYFLDVKFHLAVLSFSIRLYICSFTEQPQRMSEYSLQCCPSSDLSDLPITTFFLTHPSLITCLFTIYLLCFLPGVTHHITIHHFFNHGSILLPSHISPSHRNYLCVIV